MNSETPTAPADDARPGRALFAIVLAMLFVATFARFSYLGIRFLNDAGLYAAMGKAVVEGRQLYVEIWDTKLPGITLLTAPLYAAFGDRWWAWVTTQFAMMLAGVAALAAAVARVEIAAGRDAVSVRRARLATAAIGFALINIHWLLTTGFQLETPMLVFASIGAWATVRAIAEPTTRRAFAWGLLAGVGGGLAATLKPTALAVSGAGLVALCELMRRSGEGPRARRIALALLVGLAAMLLVNLAWYSHLGVWPYLGEVTREINLYGSGTPWSQILAPKTVLILGVLLWPAIAVGGACIALRKTQSRFARSHGGADVFAGAFVLAATWLVVEIAGTILQKRGYAYHFLPIAAPATLLAGLLVSGGGLRVRAMPIVVALAVLPAAIFSLATGFGSWRSLLTGQLTYPSHLIAYLRDHTSPDDTVFADPVGELCVMADRRPGARLGMLIYFVNHDAAPEKFSTLLINDLSDRQCTIVCLPLPEVLKGRIAAWEQQQVLRQHPARREAYRAAWQRFVDYVHANYTLEQPNLDGRQVWRRRALVPSTSQPSRPQRAV